MAMTRDLPIRPAATMRPGTRILRHRRFIAAEVVLLTGMVVLGFMARMHPGPFPGDLDVSLAWERLVRPNHMLTVVVEFFGNATWPLQAVIIAVCISAILGHFRRWLDVIISLGTAGLASLTNYTIMQLVDRPRPVGPGLHVNGHVGFPSFPSGHVEHALAYYGFLLFLTFQIRHPRSWIWIARVPLFLVVIMEGPSRLVTGEHWPSDVLAALIWGGLWLILGVHAYRWAEQRWPRLVPPNEHRESDTEDAEQRREIGAGRETAVPAST
jgi:membrane-associated phospholipid phosphatase